MDWRAILGQQGLTGRLVLLEPREFRATPVLLEM
jgi:hypothetical protein